MSPPPPIRRQAQGYCDKRGGKSPPAVSDTGSLAASFIRSRIAKGTVVYTDERAFWDKPHERFKIKRINHQEAYSLDGACTNMAEGYFFRLRRADIDPHIVGAFPGVDRSVRYRDRLRGRHEELRSPGKDSGVGGQQVRQGRCAGVVPGGIDVPHEELEPAGVAGRARPRVSNR
jgi:ISXO2-like transposase domain